MIKRQAQSASSLAKRQRHPTIEVGDRFGRLVVVAPAEKRNGQAAWLCRCDCSVERDVRASNLKKGNSTSCGCVSREKLSGEIERRRGRVRGNIKSGRRSSSERPTPAARTTRTTEAVASRSLTTTGSARMGAAGSSVFWKMSDLDHRLSTK